MAEPVNSMRRRKQQRSVTTVAAIVDLAKVARDQGIETAAKAIELERPDLARRVRGLMTGSYGAAEDR